ncbi:MAG: hypothetical protein JWQ94_4926, partial [Tardiphaga sp.]|nr:hypothetical protein [Tardiphaga sp.]
IGHFAADRDSDAGTDLDLMPVDGERLVERGDRAARQKKRLLGVADCGLHDDELVAAEPHREVVVAEHAAEAASDGLQESIARGVAVPVVGFLEAVEVDAVDGDHVALVVSPPRGALEALLEA